MIVRIESRVHLIESLAISRKGECQIIIRKPTPSWEGVALASKSPSILVVMPNIGSVLEASI
jgi:hypothetical protein